MNIKQKVITIALATFLMATISFLPIATTSAATCGGVTTAIVQCDQQGGDNATPSQTGVWGLLLMVLNILTAGVGIAAVGGMVYAAILYSSASDRAEQVKQAKDIMRDVAIGLAAYAGMYLFLNFLIPGGIFT